MVLQLLQKGKDANGNAATMGWHLAGEYGWGNATDIPLIKMEEGATTVLTDLYGDFK